MKQLTKAEAIKFAKSGKWQAMSLDERAKFQLYQKLLCMPFDEFHKAVEHLLDRPVWTHEFADCVRLQEEYEGKRPKGTVAESFQMLVDLAGDKPIIPIITE